MLILSMGPVCDRKGGVASHDMVSTDTSLTVLIGVAKVWLRYYGALFYWRIYVFCNDDLIYLIGRVDEYSYSRSDLCHGELHLKSSAPYMNGHSFTSSLS